MNIFETMEKADEAYDETLATDGEETASFVYLMHSIAAWDCDADPDRAKAARYVLLYREYLKNPRMAIEDEEFKRLQLHFAAKGWNYSAAELYARTGANSHTKEENKR